MRTVPRRRRSWWVIHAFGRNPLLRSTDRTEAGVIVFGILMAIAVTVLCVLAGVGIYRSHALAYEAQSRERHAATASVIQTEPRVPHSARVTVLARWVVGVNDRRGLHSETVRTGWVSTGKAVKNGDPIDIWVNDAGELIPPPKSPSQAGYDAVGIGAGIWCVATLGVIAIVGLLRAPVIRIRDRKWDREMKALAGGGRSNHLH
jgi:hypothetical protein